MRKLFFVFWLNLALSLSLAPLAQQPASPAGEQKAAEKSSAPAEAAALPSGPVSYASTNYQVLLDVLKREPKPLSLEPKDAVIAKTTTLILESVHISRQKFDDTMSSRFLDRYLEVLDVLHLHFLESDVKEFEQYRTRLDELTAKQGDIAPAHLIFSRFLQRLQQRVAYVGELLQNEKFEFAANDQYNVDRRKLPRPKDLEEAKHIWRQHLRYEILQERLNKEQPAAIGDRLIRRYARLLRTLKDYDNDDVLELYLSALARVYDPHTDYMGKSAFDSFNIGMKLSLFGIGALLRSEDGYCKIQSLVPNGPAAKSKQIKENDRIIAVAQGDSEPVDVVDEKLSKVVDMIRGPKDTEVRLTIIPADAADPSVRKVVRLVRDEIKLEDQEAKAKLIEIPAENGNVRPMRFGVIDLPSFYADFALDGKKSGGELKSTTADVKKLLTKLKRENVEGVILDLRRNGGGSLEEAINLTGLFIKEGPVVQVKDHDGRILIDRDEDQSVFYDGPLIVLTSRFSASASEILAGALQDYGRALIVGESSTHGKGTVQQLLQLNKSVPSKLASAPGALKVTIRKFYRASGSSTQTRGVVPDIILPSVNEFAEVGEASLENPLPWDTVPSAKYEKLNRIQPFLDELRKRSKERIASDKDFDYLREDIDQFKKALADKTVSLNEAQRLKEKQEAEARSKARQAEIKGRPESNEKVYELTLKLAGEPDLPPPVSKANRTAQESETPPTDDDAETPNGQDATRVPPVDAALKEAKHILADMISLVSRDRAVVAGPVDPKKPADDKVGGNLTTKGAAREAGRE